MTTIESTLSEQPTTLRGIADRATDNKRFILDGQSRDEMSSVIDALYEDPSERIVDEFETLRDMYHARSIRETDQTHNGWVEYTMFGTRIADGGQLEEVFTKIDESSANNKEYIRTSYIVDLLDSGERVARIVVDADGETTVEANGNQSDEDILLDFSYRTLIAEMRNAQRRPEERDAANDEALRLLNVQVFGIDKPVVTATE